MARARNDFDAGVRFGGEARGEGAEVCDGAELVALAVDEEDGLAAVFEEGEVVVALFDADGRADADEVADAPVARADFEADARADGEAGEEERQARVFGGEVVDCERGVRKTTLLCIVPPCSGCGWRTSAAPRGAA